MSHFEKMKELFSPGQLEALAKVQEVLRKDPLYLEHSKVVEEETDDL